MAGAALIAAAVGGFVTYGAMMVREKIVVAGAVKATRMQEVASCDRQRQEIAATIRQVIDRNVAEALEAARAERDTPDAPDEIARLCKASASCRDRGEIE